MVARWILFFSANMTRYCMNIKSNCAWKRLISLASACNNGKTRDLLARGTTLLDSATTIVYVDDRNKKTISIGIMIILMEVLAPIFARYKRQLTHHYFCDIYNLNRTALFYSPSQFNGNQTRYSSSSFCWFFFFFLNESNIILIR